jgi:hypothetical protein
MPHHRDNFRLNLLEPLHLDQIEHQLISLLRPSSGERISGIERVYFPHSRIKGGGAIETGMIA